MPYSTVEQVRRALAPQIAPNFDTIPAQATGTAADLSNDQLQDAITEADSMIDGMIGRFYAVPVVAVGGAAPHPIDYWSRNLAAYNATLVYRGSLDFADTDPVARRYTATMQALQAVQSGTMQLQLPQNYGDNGATGVASGGAINPYIGDLWDPRDFDVRPGGVNAYGPIPFGWGEGFR